MTPPVQTPSPGSHVLAHKGDLLTFTISLREQAKGTTWLRTNLGNGRLRLDEIVQRVELQRPVTANDWHDVPMRQTGPGAFSATVPLLEVGRFEAKTMFLPHDSNEPVWPEGTNVVIKVEPAEYYCANTFYTAFVRQFGPNKVRWTAGQQVHGESIRALDKDGYTVIPRSGSFRDLIKELDFIIGRLRCRIIHLLPVHPVPTTYARMGRYGSPFAALNFEDVDPSLAEFDRRTTPLEQFIELVDAIHERGGRAFMDIPVNHSGWASRLQIDHPDWFARGADRAFQSPGAWGVTWEDLSKLDYGKPDLWKYMANVFISWCRRGVDGFRCDAGYMVPYEAWEYIVAKVRREYPNTIFLLEGLGGKAEVVEKLLADANLDWAYSELFQNYDRGQIESYLPGCLDVSRTKGLLVHFAETHDNLRLAARSVSYALMRTSLCALASQDGAFGITNGVEWFAREKIDVHDACPLNWGSRENMADHLARLGAILECDPCFHPGSSMGMIQRGTGNVVAILRRSKDGKHHALVLANLDDSGPSRVSWSQHDCPFGAGAPHDLLSGRQAAVEKHDGTRSCALGPGEVLCLSGAPSILKDIAGVLSGPLRLPEAATRQRLKAKAMDILAAWTDKTDFAALDTDALAGRLARDPAAFCAEAAGGKLSPTVSWQWPQDAGRTVMVPPCCSLLVSCPHRFSAELRAEGTRTLYRENSLPRDDGSHFSLITHRHEGASGARITLVLSVFEPGRFRRVEAPLLFLSGGQKAMVKTSLDRQEVVRRDYYAICTNGRGAMAQVRGAWSRIQSQYDALLAGNLNADYPEDRRVMLTRCRTWILYQGYSHAVDETCLDSFSRAPDGTVTWRFTVPVGRGRCIPLQIDLRMIPGANAIALRFLRRRVRPSARWMDDDKSVRLILRPDVEDRINHEKTKAYAGPENAWRWRVNPHGHGFTFAPSDFYNLRVDIRPGTFAFEPEWSYMVAHPFDADRGFDGCSDLFSPGYFSCPLESGDGALLTAEMALAGAPSALPGTQAEIESLVCRGEEPEAPQAEQRLADAASAALRDFVVKRGAGRTVIAGYPWFLDWGRDTLIFVRGMIAAGMTREAADILAEFACFEQNGTLPNMIRGQDHSNRDTSDAPLWFALACRDLALAGSDGKKRVAADNAFLRTSCRGRTIMEVVRSIASAYISGTPNGIRMDSESGLIYSPSHFTWMDTNFPAGTPRQGYPVEIQALWHAALAFLAELEPQGRWSGTAGLVRDSIARLYPRRPASGPAYLSDCLHAAPGQPAGCAAADDALRPNQLLALTLGAINDGPLAGDILAACEELLVPGAIRTLADRPTSFALPVEHRGGLLNDPHRPYWGSYRGDEDTRRKPAYHNGTAWTWLFPSYCEALFQLHGRPARDRALAILASSTELINQACVGHVPEIADGDSPHITRGCGAQAWGASELCRVLAVLSPPK